MLVKKKKQSKVKISFSVLIRRLDTTEKYHECADDEGPKPTGREMEVPAGTLRQASLVRFQHLQSSSRDSRSAGRGTAVAGGGQGNLESKQATDHDELWASKQHAPGESGAPLMLWGHREMA